MSETRQHSYPFILMGRWVPRFVRQGSRMVYLQYYNKARAEKKTSYIEALAICAREGGRRRRLGWGMMLEERRRRVEYNKSTKGS